MDKTVIEAGTFYSELKRRFEALLAEEGILTRQVEIVSRALSGEEAIGVTKRRDFPIITGKDVMIEALCMGARGQAFTDAPAAFSGSLEEICGLDLEEPHNKGLFVASLNAVMKALGKAECTVHCRNDGPELCAVDVAAFISARYGHPRIGLIGYQPAMLERLSAEFEVRVADLSPVNIGQTRYGVLVEDGAETGQEIARDWAELVLCTGSTVCNGTMVDFLDLLDKTLFYGNTAAGAAALMGLPRLCFAERYQEAE